MICRSCGGAYFRKNKQNICLSCYTNGQRRERLFYTVKEWNKFIYVIQSELLEQYEIILTDHKTRKEKILNIFKRSEKGKERREKIKLIAHKINKGINKFSKGMNEIHLQPGAGDKSFDKIARGLNQSTGSNHNFKDLTGHASQKKIPFGGAVLPRRGGDRRGQQ